MNIADVVNAHVELRARERKYYRLRLPQGKILGEFGARFRLKKRELSLGCDVLDSHHHRLDNAVKVRSHGNERWGGWKTRKKSKAENVGLFA